MKVSRLPSRGCVHTVAESAFSRWCKASLSKPRGFHFTTAFLGGAAVVESKDIEIKRPMAGGQGRKRGLGAAQEAFVGIVQGGERGVAGIRQRIHALAQCRRRGHRHQTQRIAEKGVLAQRFDGVEVGFARALGFDQAAGGDATLTGDGKDWVNDLVDLSKTFEALPHQRQPCVCGKVVGQAFDLKVGHDGKA